MKNKITANIGSQIRFLGILIFILSGFRIAAQGTAEDPVPSAEEEPSPVAIDNGDEAPVPVSENTVEKCDDKIDNDGDGFIDCADQDCGIFAVCVSASPSNKPTKAAPVATEPVVDTVKLFERGRLCKDGIDNDKNGNIDCHDTKCQSTRYCKKVMYEHPVSPNKAPGPFFQWGIGLALPNFNWKENRVDSQYGTRIPFDPDMGGMLNFKFGVLPIKWLGFGLNINIGGTFASNRADFISLADSDNSYKYDGYKMFGHLGGFVRLQYPSKRVVPYLDIAGGYSFARYKWHVYDASESWDDISSDWEDSDAENGANDVAYETKYKQGDHFSLALEPGFDVYVVDRTVAVGAHAWIPVVSTSNKGMDNIGIMLGATFTPTWREPKRLKEEYEQ